ncbi:nitroreductase family protein [Clostridium sp. 19966]|uniref:nitroreductase family protein n=1 Tax=Clostridium sp. 19966 TaxID=2768166 RepID=UPI0028DF5222|nr:nitroreductase family protein [Clostridium sp. 19966]MDT8716509.1 nitroreductase family protein [Clostridium sp. 19966]
MDFYDVVNERKSIKDFKDTPIDNSKINRIIEAVMRAPSWKNKSCYKVILVDDYIKRQDLSECIDNDDYSAISAVKKAPIIALIVANPYKSGRVDGKDFYLVDAGIAMEHLVLAATAEGYGTCWIGSLLEDRIRELLNIPEEYRVIAMTPIGVTELKSSHYPEKEEQNYVFHNEWNSEYTSKEYVIK